MQIFHAFYYSTLNVNIKCELCTIGSCPNVTVSDGQVQHTGLHLGNYLTVQCNRGTKLVGSEVSQCLSDGTWSGTKPLCKRMLI